MDKIFIKGLTVETVIGIHPHEHAIKQPLIIDIELFTDISTAAKSNQIADTIDYELVAKRVAEIIAQEQFKLLEPLVVHIVETLLQEFNANEVHCQITKPKAIPQATTAGIAIIRKRH